MGYEQSYRMAEGESSVWFQQCNRPLYKPLQVNRFGGVSSRVESLSNFIFLASPFCLGYTSATFANLQWLLGAASSCRRTMLLTLTVFWFLNHRSLCWIFRRYSLSWEKADSWTIWKMFSAVSFLSSKLLASQDLDWRPLASFAHHWSLAIGFIPLTSQITCENDRAVTLLLLPVYHELKTSWSLGHYLRSLLPWLLHLAGPCSTARFFWVF